MTRADMGGWGLARTVAAVFGVVYLVIGVMGFIPGVVTGGAPADMPSAEGSLLGIFPINMIHNVVHLLIAAILLFGAMSRDAAIGALMGVGAAYILFAVLGVFFPDGFGLLPLGGADIWLHVATGAILLAVAWTERGQREGVRTA